MYITYIFALKTVSIVYLPLCVLAVLWFTPQVLGVLLSMAAAGAPLDHHATAWPRMPLVAPLLPVYITRAKRVYPKNKHKSCFRLKYTYYWVFWSKQYRVPCGTFTHELCSQHVPA